VKRLSLIVGVWSLSLLVCAAVVVVAFLRLDVPVAQHLWGHAHYLSPLGEGLGAAILLTGESAVILSVLIVRLTRGHVPAISENLAIACLSSICAYGINDHVLKMLFGVATPQSVVHGARHILHLYAGSEGSSFPSGHMALAGGFAGVFMRLYRVSIWPMSALLLIGAGLLLAGDWHFVSDIIAGTFFGVSAGLLAGEGRAAHSAR
jgi:hypothetical protein